MKPVLNFCTGKLCSKVVSFWQSGIRVWQLCTDFVNYLPFGVLHVFKQWCRPRRPLAIAYPFELLKGAYPLSTQMEMKSSFEALL